MRSRTSTTTWARTSGDKATAASLVQGYLPSDRPVAVDRDAVHHAALPVIVVERVMLDAAIVPERDRIRFPAEAAGEFRPHRMLPQEVQQRPALLDRHVLEADGKVAVDVEAFPAGLGMGANHRVFGLAVGGLASHDLHRAEPL